MKKIFILLILSTFTLQSFAQSTVNSTLTEDSKALQFQIGSNFTLTSFQGSAFSFKYHLKPELAFRIGVSLDLNNGSSDKNQNNLNYNDSLYNYTKVINMNYYNYKVRFNTNIILYSKNSFGLYFFYGVGPFLSVGLVNQKFTETPILLNYPTSVYNSETKEKELSLGLTGVGGVEWFISKSISIHAEYSLSAAYNWYKQEITTNQTTSPNISKTQETRNYITTTGNGVRFGLSIYF